MDLLALIAAYLIAQGAHTGGHYAEASRQGIPISIHNGTEEKWGQDNIKKDVDMNGAGFNLQDTVVNNAGSKEASAMSAIIKAMYLAGVPGMINKNLVGAGDINNMTRESGNKYIPHMVGATALSDMIGVNDPNRNWSLGFSTFGTGQPGLVYNHRF